MIPVMINGLPGKMAKAVYDLFILESGISVCPRTLTGPEVPGEFLQGVILTRPDDREKGIKQAIECGAPKFISVDYTHPSAVNENVDFYCRHNLPFVMGTTGGDRAALEERVRGSEISAVVAPNMAKQVVAFQALMKKLAEANPEVLRGYHLKMIESHQNGKADTSGTMKAMVEQPDGSPGVFNQLGIPFTKKQIVKIREPEEQKALGVPEKYLEGHGWHTYELSPGSGDAYASIRVIGDLLHFIGNSNVFDNYEVTQIKDIPLGGGFAPGLQRTSRDKTCMFSVGPGKGEDSIAITHNINGRVPYAQGTLDAVRFLAGKLGEGSVGKVYSMADVLEEAA